MPKLKKVEFFCFSFIFSASFDLLSAEYILVFIHHIPQYFFTHIITEYGEDSCLIPKNTSLIIARVPLPTRSVKKSWDPTAEKAAASASARERKNVDSQAGNIDLTLMNGTEEEKITAMMKQSTMDYDPRK